MRAISLSPPHARLLFPRAHETMRGPGPAGSVARPRSARCVTSINFINFTRSKRTRTDREIQRVHANIVNFAPTTTLDIALSSPCETRFEHQFVQHRADAAGTPDDWR